MNVTVDCKECGMICNSIKGLTLHVNQRHNMDSKAYYDKYYKTETDGICPVCGKETSFYRISQGGYFKFCSKKCSAQSIDTKQKKLETNIEKYGGIGFASKELSDKTKETCKEKYGTEYASQSNEFKTLVKEHALKNYGVSSVNKCDWKIEKSKETNLNNCGYITNLLKPETALNSKLKYKEYAFNLLKTKYSEFVNYSDKLDFYVCHCDKCNTNYEINKYLFYDRKTINIDCCTICNPINTPYSNAEKEVYNYITTIYEGVVEENNRTILAGKELDIYIPEKHIAFEYDGLYWHNELNKSNDYHVSKTNECELKGVQLIHIFEDEWVYKQDIVKSRIRGLLGLNDRIFARKCIIKEVSYTDSEKFLNDNHIQGNCTSKYRYGLYYNNELVSLMTFGLSRFNKNEFELIRFCNRLNLNVIGGASKLFKYFLNTHKDVNQIISFADRRWSLGNLYVKLGFAFDTLTDPSYFYVVDNLRENRIKYQKHKLVSEGYDSSLSEHEIMLQREIYRIYDCGNLKYIFKREP